MPGWVWVLFWWLCFAGSHIILSSSGVRAALIARLGQLGFMALYSVIALITFSMLVSDYFGDRYSGPWLHNLAAQPWAQTAALVLAALAWMLIVASNIRPSPTSMAPVKPQARGLTRITRHPMLAGVALWGLSHLLVNASLSSVIFFGGFIVYSIIGAAHQDSRKRADPELAAFYRETSLVPFAAIIAGRNRLAPSELPWLALGVGLIVAALIYGAHFWLRG